jgi:hypothetical protein
MRLLAITLAAVAVLVVGAILLVGPTKLYHTHHEHEGSPAYWNRSASFLKGHHHARVCDHMPNLHNARVEVDTRGSNVKKYDRNGVRQGCGDVRFSKYGRGHRTCEGNNCGGWSRH